MFHHLIGDPIINSSMLVDEVMPLAERILSRKPANLNVSCKATGVLNCGFVHRTPFNGTAERNYNSNRLRVKIGIKQKKTDLFDRFFRVVPGGPDGLRTRDRKGECRDLTRLIYKSGIISGE